MRTAMRPRYYCDHCNKGNGSPSAMRRHEGGCTLNPQRVCGMCKMQADSFEPAPPRDELVRVMDERGFNAMCEAANNCPACILAALRTKNFKGDDETPPGVLGPEDGRETWSYTQAKQAWWAAWTNSHADVFWAVSSSKCNTLHLVEFKLGKYFSGCSIPKDLARPIIER